MTVSYNKLNQFDQNIFQPMPTPLVNRMNLFDRASNIVDSTSNLEQNDLQKQRIHNHHHHHNHFLTGNNLDNSRLSKISCATHFTTSEIKCSSFCTHLNREAKLKQNHKSARELEEEQRRIDLLLTQINCNHYILLLLLSFSFKILF